MMIETKPLSSNEIMLFFGTPLPIQGTFYQTKTTPSDNFLPLQNIMSSELADTLLLTADFIYLKSTSEETLEDLTTLAMAETDDYISSSPNWQTAPVSLTEEKINIILKTLVAPLMQRDGGDIELLSFTDHTATVRFLGKCHGCPYAQRTLKECVAKNLIRYLPDVKEVVMA